ncbi:hypothetical protein JFV29_01835 [Peribacillus sp. TH16]|uniref:hypothetical protein n=1 Tax=Peribacillus sp. TH16 TaxID=2798482 RepID=UPI0019115BDC|nr:hypothetical protein [Peribacillus sp. TH16]MBK5480696.1 hypothetical protein [Peribacillus sp. TH16]
MTEIQQRLGHTDIQTTMNIYANTTDNMKEKASQQFSKLMEDLHFKDIYMLGNDYIMLPIH